MGKTAMLNYEDYTKRNHVTKALRLELIPQGNTLNTIAEKGDLAYDKELYSSLERLKPIIDSYIKYVASKSLSTIDFDFSAMYDAYINKDKKSWTKEEKAVQKLINKAVDNVLPKGMKCSQINSAAFLQDVLKEYVINTNDVTIKKDEAVKDIEETKGCLSLFNKFLISRITALTTWMPDRVVENFKIYCDNIKKIEAALDESEVIKAEYGDELELMKAPDYYNHFLTQNDIDGYNHIISGAVNDKGIITKGLNVLINEYNTDVKNLKSEKPFLRKVNKLYKQILVPVEKQFSFISIKTDNEVRELIKNTWDLYDKAISDMMDLLAEKVSSSDGNGIYIRGNRIHQLSHIILGDHKAITNNLINKELVDINNMLSNTNLKNSMRKELEKRVEIIQSLVTKKNYMFTDLDNVICNNAVSTKDNSKTAFQMFVTKTNELMNESKLYYKVLQGGDVLSKRNIKGDRHVQEMLVDFFASLTEVRDILSIIYLPEDKDDVDIAFYNVFDEIFENIRLTYKAENLVRNYVTKSIKDIAEEKQTCFGSPARFRTQWWNGEKKFSKEHASIIKHDNKYYYFILACDSKPINICVDKQSDTGFLTQKKGQKSFMMLPKILFTDHAVPFFNENKDAEEYVFDDSQVINPITVTKEIFDIYNNGLFKREAVNSGAITEKEYKENIYKLIDKYIEFANVYVQYQKFNISNINDPSRYNDIGEFFSEIDTCTSRLSWTNIDYNQIQSLVNEGKAYLFLISNKVLYEENKRKDPYSKTFISILSESNMDKTTILLNSNPVVFYRPQLLKKEITHKVGSILVNKLTDNGEHIPKRIYETIYKLKNGITSISEGDIQEAKKYMTTHNVCCHKATENKYYRGNYMSEKYIIQLTYTKNNDVSDRVNDMLNNRVLEDIKDGCNIISVARSTKDLVYIMALDNKLNILEERSLNVIDGINYYSLLRDTYIEKKENKKIWIYDTENANIKNAYIDLAITKILKLAKKYNAIIVVESISDNVKNKYSYLDNQVFKFFENRLAQRLSDLAFKEIENGKPGSVSNPLQLSNNNDNTYQDGILFYVNGAYTRNIDPQTGFINLFDFSRINSISSKRQFFSKMRSITYTGDSFVFEFEYSDFLTKINTDKTQWVLHLSGDVTYYDKEKKKSVKIKDVVSERLIPLAGKTDLDGNIALEILDKKVPGAFVEELYKWFRYILLGTHSKVGSSEEFYRSPIDGLEYNISNMLAYNLANKFVFKLEYAGETKDFSKAWVDYLQA